MANVERSKMESFARGLREAKDSGALSQEQFHALHARFRGQDSSGRTWTVGLQSLEWHRLEGDRWLNDTPPARVEVEERVLAVLGGLPQPSPAPFAPPPVPVQAAPPPPPPPAPVFGRPPFEPPGPPSAFVPPYPPPPPMPPTQTPVHPFVPDFGAPPPRQGICQVCGAPLRPGIRFCENCGAKAGPPQVSAPPPPPPPPPPAPEPPPLFNPAPSNPIFGDPFFNPPAPTPSLFATQQVPVAGAGPRCPVCGAAGKPADVFCEACGTRFQAAAPPPTPQFGPQEKRCPNPQCGATMPPDRKFCTICGTRI